MGRMHRLLQLLMVLGLFLFVCTAKCYSQTSKWKAHATAGKAAFERENYTEAAKSYLLAAKEAEKMGRYDARLGTELDKLAEALKKQDNYSEAQAVYEQAIVIREKALGSDSLDLASSLEGFAQNYNWQAYKFGRDRNAGIISKIEGEDGERRNYLQAESCYRRALAIREKKLPADDPVVLRDVVSLATACLLANDFEAAKPLIDRLNDVWQEEYRSGRPDCADKLKEAVISLNNLGVAYINGGKYSEAIALFDKALLLNPNYRLAYDNRSIAKRRLGDNQGADEDERAGKRIGVYH